MVGTHVDVTNKTRAKTKFFKKTGKYFVFKILHINFTHLSYNKTYIKQLITLCINEIRSKQPY
jgi:hypothetical protein